MKTDEVTLDGRESALLVAALFMARHWPFEKEAARAMLPPDQESLDPAYEQVSLRWRQRLAHAGLWHPTGKFWTRELIAQRGQLADGLRLSQDELADAVLALRVSAVEFATSWWEFCTASVGAVEWYGLELADLTTLADRLEGVGRSS
jgi:hypothetical protein